jgi:hypothetical protein
MAVTLADRIVPPHAFEKAGITEQSVPPDTGNSELSQ